ncbi:hypothetical protein KUCAC02_029130, partial [Chaenocephalus aceratus]
YPPPIYGLFAISAAAPTLSRLHCVGQTAAAWSSHTRCCSVVCVRGGSCVFWHMSNSLKGRSRRKPTDTRGRRRKTGCQELLSRVPPISRLIPAPITQRHSRPIGADMGAPGGTKVLLLVFLVGWEKSLGLNWNPIPRKDCSIPGCVDSMARFSVQGVFNYSMLTLSDHERVLYVGARETLFALDPNNINRQLRPQIEWPAPQDKKRECVAKGKNNQIRRLYSATLNNFLGTEPVILRNLGVQHYSMKSEYLPAWLNGRSSGSKDGDDDKIYFFFSERALELDCDTELNVAEWLASARGIWVVPGLCRRSGPPPESSSGVLPPRAPRLLQQPEGGVHAARQDWRGTTFLTASPSTPSGEGDVDVSAVCQYQISDVKKGFEGSYKEYREPSQRWGRYNRGGPCPTAWS